MFYNNFIVTGANAFGYRGVAVNKKVKRILVRSWHDISFILEPQRDSEIVYKIAFYHIILATLLYYILYYYSIWYL